MVWEHFCFYINYLIYKRSLDNCFIDYVHFTRTHIVRVRIYIIWIRNVYSKADFLTFLRYKMFYTSYIIKFDRSTEDGLSDGGKDGLTGWVRKWKSCLLIYRRNTVLQNCNLLGDVQICNSNFHLFDITMRMLRI